MFLAREAGGHRGPVSSSKEPGLPSKAGSWVPGRWLADPTARGEATSQGLVTLVLHNETFLLQQECPTVKEFKQIYNQSQQPDGSFSHFL